jgi:peptide/nickel transport system ATP-binding protein
MQGRKGLVEIPGRLPSIDDRPRGCVFAPRCEYAQERCTTSTPSLAPIATGHYVRCIRADEVRGQTSRRFADRAPDSPISSEPILSLEGVSASYGEHIVVHDINLQLGRHECLALVGQSGAGKSTLARSVAGLHAKRSGQILLEGRPLAPGARQRPRLDRQAIQYVFQNPYGSLNPRHTVGHTLGQPLEMFRGLRGSAARAAQVEMLERVALPIRHVDRYPEELSGGERQRVAIARALSCNPRVLICDEVTSSLDLSVQAEIVGLLVTLQRDLGLALVFVTHSLPLVRSIAQRVAVMSAGRIVEIGPVDQILRMPSQPYSKRLLADARSLELEMETASPR